MNDPDDCRSVTVRPYDPDSVSDREGLWECKRSFELGLGDASPTDEKREAYEAKLTSEYRDRYFTWADDCSREQSASVTLAVRESDGERPIDDVIGYVFVLPESLSFIWDAAVVNELYLEPAFRGTGVADDLMDVALDVAAEQDLPLDRVVLDVDSENERARAFYDRHGFDHWGEMVARKLYSTN